MTFKHFDNEFWGIVIRWAGLMILWYTSTAVDKLQPGLLLLGVLGANLARVTELIEVGVLMLMVSFGLEFLPRVLTYLAVMLHLGSPTD